jgi:hypothetical protein
MLLMNFRDLRLFVNVLPRLTIGVKGYFSYYYYYYWGYFFDFRT